MTPEEIKRMLLLRTKLQGAIMKDFSLTLDPSEVRLLYDHLDNWLRKIT